METYNIPKLPVGTERKLKDYMAAFVMYREMRKRQGIDVAALDNSWRKSQAIAVRIEEDLVREFGADAAAELLQKAIGVRSIPRIS